MDPNTGSNSTLRAVSPPRGYVLSGKLMLSGIVVLFGIAIFLLFLHLYVRWHVRRRHDRLRRQLNRLILSSPWEEDQNVHPKSAPCGLDKEVLNSLSIEIFSDDDDDVELAKCTVCLTEFDEGEKVRVLPRCAHRFHVDCIDMWFCSHSTCPLCRCAVEAVTSPTPAAEPAFSQSAVSAPDPRIREVRIDIPEESGSSTSPEVAPVKLPGHRVISSIRRFFIGELRVESDDQPSSTPPPLPPPAAAQ